MEQELVQEVSNQVALTSDKLLLKSAKTNVFKDEFCNMSNAFILENRSDMSTMTNTHERISNKFASAQSMIDTRCSELADCVSSLSSQNDKNMIGISDSVKKTAVMAENVLGQVTSSASTMGEDGVASMERFTSYLNKHGDNLAQDLSMHLQDASEAMQSLKPQGQKLDTADDLNLQFTSSIVESSGDTPSKQLLLPVLDTPLTELFLTRNRDVIHSDVGKERMRF
jgi:hypothetical protein